MGHGFSELLSAMGERQEQGYIELQQCEWEAGADIPPRSHHEFSGVPYHHLMGEAYSSARLGRGFVEELPEDTVV
jgi:hypothetical protein